MEYVDGETLARIMARLKEVEPETETAFGKKESVVYFCRLAEAFADVADGLQHAHSKGVIHRDIKPSNLILDAEGDRGGRAKGRLRILDFGLARLEGQESLTLSGDLVGTPAYMSPEQARRRKIPVDYRTDIYSLGATLYETLSGRPPFQGKDHQDTLSQIIEHDPTPLGRVNPRTPIELETIVLKCLRKDPADRYGTAEALAQDLRRFSRGDPIEARPQRPLERVVRRLKRQRTKWLVGAVILLLVILVGWLQVKLRREEYEKNLATYEPAVQDAVLKIFAGQLRHQAREGRSGRLIEFGGSRNPFTAEDFRRFAEADTSDPVEQAVEELETLVARFPSKRDAHFHLARAYSTLERREDAGRELARALECDPVFVPARMLQLELAANNPEERRAGLQDLWSEYEKTSGWEKWWILAHKAVRDTKWFDAAKAYRTLVAYRERKPYIGFSIDTYMGCGSALLEAADYVGAQAAFISAETICPASIEPGLFLARAYHLAGDTERAKEKFRLLHDQSALTEKQEVALLIVAAYTFLRDFGGALDWTEQLGDEGLAARLKTYFLFRLGRKREAVDSCRETLERNPEDPIAHFVSGLVLFDDLMSLATEERERRLPNLVETARKAVDLAGEFSPAGDLLEAVVAETRRVKKQLLPTRLTTFSNPGGQPGVGRPKQGFFDNVKKLAVVNGPLREESAFLSPNGLELFFGSTRNTNSLRNFDIWVTTRDTPNASFGELRNVVELNTPFMDYPCSLSANGLTLYFCSNRPGGRGQQDLYEAKRSSLGAPFGKAWNIEELNTEWSEWYPSVTADGLEIYFSRGRNHASEKDLYVATRDHFGPRFGAPVPVSEVNTPFHEFCPRISPDGLTLFWSDHLTHRPGTAGLGDLWMATRERRFESGERVPFGSAVNLGDPLNTQFQDLVPAVSFDWPASGSKIYFNRYLTRDGWSGEVYEATWHQDCNRNGVDDAEELSSGMAQDRNQNGIPDSCGIELNCQRSEDGKTVDLRWTYSEPESDGIRILRDGAPIAELSGERTNYRDTRVPAGLATYQLIAVAPTGDGTGPICEVPD